MIKFISDILQIASIAILWTVLTETAAAQASSPAAANLPPVKITAAEAVNHYRQNAIVSGKVASVSVRSAVVILSIDKPFPDAPFTAVVFSQATSRFGSLANLQGKGVEIKGTIKPFRGKPEIILDDPNQLTVIGPAKPDSATQTEQVPKISEDVQQAEITRITGTQASVREIFKLNPSEHLSVADVNDAILTWKNHHLDQILRKAKTDDLRDYADMIEHTILHATDAEEREKNEAQGLVANGGTVENPHSALARAYHLRIDVLKPILAAMKEEVANRSK